MRKLILSVLGLVCATGSFRVAQAPDSAAPRIANARIENRTLAGQLASEVNRWAGQSSGPQWMGYAVSQISGDRRVCCGNYSSGDGDCGTCRLERGHNDANITSRNTGTVNLEGPRNLLVLLRAENKQVTKIRVASEECTLDAGGLTFIWLTGVKSTESVTFLEAFVAGNDVDSGDSEKKTHGALTAIAMHADPAADRALESFVQPSQRDSLRRQAAFWLGEARGAAGLRVLQNMAKNDPSSDVRAHVTFALSVSREPGALQEMIRMARSDESAHVRGQALFWLAHKAGEKAVGTITGAIDNDPDTDVKKKAVFALSQLPKDEGVPKLIEVAQNNRNREVRKQAMFWLGQSNDPRALAFFEKILSR